MLTRFIAIADVVIQYLQAKHVFTDTRKTSGQSEATMIKEVINETTASIELKLHNLYFKLALGLVAVGVLAYGVVRLIWHFESYLFLNYGQNFAVWFIAGIVVVTALAMVYGKYMMDRASKEKKKFNQEKADHESALEAAEPGFFAMPERLLHQVFVGFIDGFQKPRQRHREVPTGNSLSDVGRVDDLEYRQHVETLKLDHLRSASH